MEPSLNILADSESCEINRQTVQRAINTDRTLGGDVVLLVIDYKCFEKDDKEKGLLHTLRNKWREGMKARWGSEWKKHNNYV